MKKLLILLFLISAVSVAQISKVDFDKQKKIISGNDPKIALSNQEFLEKKFPNDAQVLCLRGLYQFRDSDPNGALMSFSKAIKTNPKLAFAYACRSQVFAQKQLIEKAIGDISQAISLEPKNAEWVNLRAGFYYLLQKLDLGLEDKKTLIKLEPNQIMNYFDAATFAKELDNNTNADIYFDQAYANKNIQKYITDVLFAKFLLRFRRFEEAKTKYESALLTNEKDFGNEDLHDVGIVFYKLKNYEKAIIFIKKAIALNRNDANYFVNLASVYLDKKEYQNVKQTAEMALKVDSNNSMANMFMAIGLKYTGNETLAIQYEEKAKQLDKNQN